MPKEAQSLAFGVVLHIRYGFELQCMYWFTNRINSAFIKSVIISVAHHPLGRCKDGRKTIHRLNRFASSLVISNLTEFALVDSRIRRRWD